MKYNLSEFFVCKGQACRKMHSHSQLKREWSNSCLLAEDKEVTASDGSSNQVTMG